MNAVATIICPSCGAAATKIKKNCNHCGNFLLQVTRLELNLDQEGAVFRSLSWLYKSSIWLAFLSAVLIYTVFFSFISETWLLVLSPVWFLLIHFGTAGLFIERSIYAILGGKATNFDEALALAQKNSMPIAILLVFLSLKPIIAIFRLQKLNSPLKLALISGGIWAVVLAIFLLFIFPTL